MPPTRRPRPSSLRQPRGPNPRARCRRRRRRRLLLVPSPTGRYSRRLRGGVGIKGLRSPRRDQSATGPELLVASVLAELHPAVLAPPGIQNLHSRAGSQPRSSASAPPLPAPPPHAGRSCSHGRRRPRLCRLARSPSDRGAARTRGLRKKGAQPPVPEPHRGSGLRLKTFQWPGGPLLPPPRPPARALRRARSRVRGDSGRGGASGSRTAQQLKR